MTTPRRVIVTGGAGFIGSHLVERLLHDGNHVTIIDNFSTGTPENLSAMRSHPRLTVHEMDVTDVASLKTVFVDAAWVFHLAALADIVPSIQKPIAYHATNVDGTISVLECARYANVERLVYAASSSCYGIPEAFPTPETSAIKPMYPYALTKFVGERYVLHWNQVYKVPCISLRLFNVYGPRSRTSGAYGAVFGVFLAQKLAGKPLTVVGDGSQTRDFVFVRDVVDAFVTAAASDIAGEVFNVGSGRPQSVNRLVELLGGDAIHVPKRPGEPDCTHADISKIQNKLGWRPQTRFEVGVKIMLEHIDQWRKAPIWDERSIAEATRDWFTYLGADNSAGAVREKE